MPSKGSIFALCSQVNLFVKDKKTSADEKFDMIADSAPGPSTPGRTMHGFTMSIDHITATSCY
jgi:hypothetical protein